MSGKNFRQTAIEWGIAILIFLALSIAFFTPVFQGKILIQTDALNFKAMSKETLDYNASHDDAALWTGTMFGGMPTFLIHLEHSGNLFAFLNKAIGLWLPRPANYLFMSCLTFFILLRSFRVRNWLAIFGAISFAIGTYMISFIEAGHNTKVHAFAIMPLVLAGVNYLFRGKTWLGFSVALLGMCLEIDANHIQITYYMYFLLFCWFAAELVFAYREKKMVSYWKVFGLFALISVLSFTANFSRLYTTYVYSEESIRGGSELTKEGDLNANYAGNGLSKDYVFAWSYGMDESMTLLFPNFAGQASGKSFLEDEDSKSMAYIRQLYARQPDKAQQMQQFTGKYWGPLQFTSGPVYLGAVVAFLFLLGAFAAENRMRWWLIAGSVVSLMLGWGDHFKAFNYFMYDHFPMYNKFRTVMMALIIFCLTAPLLGFYILEKYMREGDTAQKFKAWKYALIVIGVLTLLVLIPVFDPSGPRDEQLMSAYGQDPDIAGLVSAVHADRVSMIRMDGLRTLVFIALSAGLIWLYLKGRVKAIAAVLGIGLLSVIDLWTVNSIYLNADNYDSPDYYARYFASRLPVINDEDPNYRVLNTTVRFDQDGVTPWSYHSIGGYHAAKLRRYQDVIDGYLNNGAMNVINMLNAKYVIVSNNGQLATQRNPGACGNAWLVDSVVFVNGPDAEFEALKELEPRRYAVVDEQFKDQLQQVPERDSTAGIIMLNYSPNEITYKFKGNSAQIAVFSEIFYRGNEDWKAYIDGEYQDHFRADYLLRGMLIPAGEHDITFRFEPSSYYTGRKISLGASSILLLLIAAGFWMSWRKDRENGSATE